MNRKIENFFSSLDTLHEASVTDYTQNKIVLKWNISIMEHWDNFYTKEPSA